MIQDTSEMTKPPLFAWFTRKRCLGRRLLLRSGDVPAHKHSLSQTNFWSISPKNAMINEGDTSIAPDIVVR